MQLRAKETIKAILEKAVPYTVNILGTDLLIDSHNVYPPGKLTQFVLNYLLQNIDIKDKAIADIGAGCSAYGIVLAKNGAKLVIGLDINEEAVRCSNRNIRNYSLQDCVKIIHGNGAEILLDNYRQTFDFIVTGSPWSTISEERFDKISYPEKAIYRAFYDIEDGLINSVLNTGFQLLKYMSSNIYMTGCLNIMPRLEKIFSKHHVSFKIVAEEDIHNDGNLHYVLRLNKQL